MDSLGNDGEILDFDVFMEKVIEIMFFFFGDVVVEVSKEV